MDRPAALRPAPERFVDIAALARLPAEARRGAAFCAGLSPPR